MLLDLYDIVLKINDTDGLLDTCDAFILPFVKDTSDALLWTVNLYDINELIKNGASESEIPNTWLAENLPEYVDRHYTKICREDKMQIKYISGDIIISIQDMVSGIAVLIILPNESRIFCFADKKVIHGFNLFFYKFLYYAAMQNTNVNSIMLHGAALNVRGTGVVLLGDSGAGKTTACNFALQNGYEILTDESPIIIKDGKTFWVGGSPWSGSEKKHIGMYKKIPLSAFFCLSKSLYDTSCLIHDKNIRIEHLNRQVASYDILNKNLALRNASGIFRLSSEVPMHLLEFTKSRRFLDTISDALIS